MDEVSALIEQMYNVGSEIFQSVKQAVEGLNSISSEGKQRIFENLSDIELTKFQKVQIDKLILFSKERLEAYSKEVKTYHEQRNDFDREYIWDEIKPEPPFNSDLELGRIHMEIDERIIDICHDIIGHPLSLGDLPNKMTVSELKELIKNCFKGFKSQANLIGVICALEDNNHIFKEGTQKRRRQLLSEILPINLSKTYMGISKESAKDSQFQKGFFEAYNKTINETQIVKN